MWVNSYADKTVVERIVGVSLSEQPKLIEAIMAGLSIFRRYFRSQIVK